MRISYVAKGRHIKLHGTKLVELIDQIPDTDQQEFAREHVQSNVSGETFARIMRDKFNWEGIDLKECACSCARAI